MSTITRKQIVYITIVILSQLLYPCSSIRRCSHGLEYGEDCSFVPAPPGHTPACAAPGYTYCEQLDYYPNDIIKHLVEKGEFDFSTLLSDETRDDFGATRPTQGPYGYGPHSLSGTQGISLVTERPTFLPKQPQGQDQYHGSPMYTTNNGQYSNQGNFHGYQYFGPSKGNTLSPPGGYTGYFTPSQQHRPQTQPYQPPRDLSYLPPKVSSNATVNNRNNGADFLRGIRLDQYEDFWRGNPYFEVPKSQENLPSAGFNGDRYRSYDSNNGAKTYYSETGYETGPRHQTLHTPGQIGWTTATATTTTQYNGGDQRSFDHFIPPAVTNYNPNEWWQQYTNDPTRPTNTQQSTFKSLDSNEIKLRNRSKRNSVKNNIDALKSTKSNPFTDGSFSRKKRQSSNGEQLCPTRSQFIQPRAALNKQGNWMYVVNMGSTMEGQYSQLVKSEVCVSQQCNGICTLPIGYTSRCEQRYVQKRLVALDQTGQKLYNDVFWFPSCCLCTIANNQT